MCIFYTFSSDTLVICTSMKYVFMSKLLSKEKIYFNWHKSKDTSYIEYQMENSTNVFFFLSVQIASGQKRNNKDFLYVNRKQLWRNKMNTMSWENANKNRMKAKPIMVTVVWLKHVLNFPVSSYKPRYYQEIIKISMFLVK